MKLNCPQCGAVLNVPDTAAGKRIRCPKCQHEFRVPATGSNAAPSNVGQQAPPVPEPSPADALADAVQHPRPARRSPVVRTRRPEVAFWRKYLGVILVAAGVLLAIPMTAHEEKQPERQGPGKKANEEVSFVQTIPGFLIISGVIIIIVNRRKRKREREEAQRAHERAMLAEMSPAEQDAHMRQQQLELERQKAAAEQKRQEGLKTDSIALGALGWHLANRQREATEDQTKAIKEQTEELKRQKR